MKKRHFYPVPITKGKSRSGQPLPRGKAKLLVPHIEPSMSSSSSSSYSSSSSSSADTTITLYYVGNAGSAATWNDANYWSLTSGGPGGAGVPTAAENVVFDSNSPDCRLEALCTAYCKDFTFTAGFSNTVTTTTFNTSQIRISGNVLLLAGLLRTAPESIGGSGWEIYMEGASWTFTAEAGVLGNSSQSVWRLNAINLSWNISNTGIVDLHGNYIKGFHMHSAPGKTSNISVVSDMSMKYLQSVPAGGTINWTVTNGKTITVEDGSLCSFNGGTWRSSSSGNAWLLTVVSNSPTATNIDVKDCDASGGVAIDATDPSNTDSGGNTNWLFS